MDNLVKREKYVELEKHMAKAQLPTPGAISQQDSKVIYISPQQHEQGERMEMPISTGTAISSNITIQIAQPQQQPQPAVKSITTQSSATRDSGDPFFCREAW